MIVKDINDTDFTFDPKRLKLRKFRELMECIEAIQESKKFSTTTEQLEKGLAICLDNFDPEKCELDFNAAMEVMAETVKVNRVGVDDRKKSE